MFWWRPPARITIRCTNYNDYILSDMGMMADSLLNNADADDIEEVEEIDELEEDGEPGDLEDLEEI